MGKVALVTGGSRGIGKGCALELAKAGYDIAITYVGNDEAANQTIKELKAIGIKAKAYKFDISDKTACTDAVNKVQADFERIDVLINNAGTTRDGLFIRMNDENWEAVINTNLNSAFYMTQPISKIMMKLREGCIINMSSIVGIRGNAGQANYSAAKAALAGATKALAAELGPKQITVNAVAPGVIDTELWQGEADNDLIRQRIPMRRAGTPEEVAHLVAFLISEKASYITGPIIGIDGGGFA